MLTTEHFVRARATLARRHAARQAHRYARPIHGPQIDPAEMIVDFADPPAPPLALHLVYSDASGRLSGRCVTLRKLKAEVGEVRVTAFCHMRDRLRTFLGSRAVEVTDLATGEVHEDGLEFFAAHPLLQGMTADDLAARSPALLAVQECRDELILLSVLAAADGELHEVELDAMVSHVLDAVPDEAVTEPEVRARVRAFVPDEWAFSRALQRMCGGAGEPRRLLRSMRRVVDADGELDPEEVAFVIEIESRLRAAGRI